MAEQQLKALVQHPFFADAIVIWAEPIMPFNFVKEALESYGLEEIPNNQD